MDRDAQLVEVRVSPQGDPRAAEFGVDPQAVAGMRRPLLVRMLKDPGAPGDLSRSLNERLQAGKSAVVDSASRAHLLTEEIVRYVAATVTDEDGASTLRASIRALPVASHQRLMEMMRAVGAWNQSEAARFIDEDGRIDADGVDSLEQMLTALSITGPDVAGTLMSAGPAMRAKLATATPRLMAAKAEGLPVADQLRQALYWVAASRAAWKESRIPAGDYYLDQGAISRPPWHGDPVVATLAYAADKLGPRVFASAIGSIVDMSGTSVFSPEPQPFEQAVAAALLERLPERMVQSLGDPATWRFSTPDHAGRADDGDASAVQFSRLSDAPGLLLLHNLTLANLRHAARMGGLPVPSLAVTRDDAPITDFGELALLADPSLLDRSDTHTFDADIYSPRYPQVTYTVSRPQLMAAFESLREAQTELTGKAWMDFDEADVRRKGIEAFTDDTAVRLAFLRDTNRAPDLAGESNRRAAVDQRIRAGEGLYDELRAWAERRFGNIITNERIIRESVAGNRREEPHTLERVVRAMKRNLRGSDGMSIFGMEPIRALVSNRLRSKRAVQAQRARLMPEAAIIGKDGVKEQMNARFFQWADGLRAQWPAWSAPSAADRFGYYDAAMEVLAEIARGRKPDWVSVPPEQMAEARQLLQEVAAAPTEYFEVKPLRAVPLRESKAAVAPAHYAATVSEILGPAGVPVYHYDQDAGPEARAEAVRQAATDHSLLFSRATDQGIQIVDLSALTLAADRENPIGPGVAKMVPELSQEQLGAAFAHAKPLAGRNDRLGVMLDHNGLLIPVHFVVDSRSGKPVQIRYPKKQAPLDELAGAKQIRGAIVQSLRRQLKKSRDPLRSDVVKGVKAAIRAVSQRGMPLPRGLRISNTGSAYLDAPWVPMLPRQMREARQPRR
ncbi:MAG: hypothetical protein KF724_02425 [Phycisphaeraceae bacterium]|nr:hypothetical protein [Phycisphaeraceae bacterium]